MYLFNKQEVPWPPVGWKHFSAIKKLCGRALDKNPKTATVSGLSYRVEVNPVCFNKDSDSYIYSLYVDGWSYSIQNESHEYPVISFDFLDRKIGENNNLPYLSNLKTRGMLFEATEINAHRAVMASLFFMKQISSKNVPDYNQVLKLYRLEHNAILRTYNENCSLMDEVR